MAYNPSKHTTSNKPYGISGIPTDARSFFYDESAFKYRQYVSTQEVIDYLVDPTNRIGNFFIIINSTGTLTNGVITGGTNDVYWFKDGTEEENLIPVIFGSNIESTDNVPEGINNLYFTEQRVNDLLEGIYQPVGNYALKTLTSKISDITVGGINVGDTIPANTDLIDLINRIFTKIYYPNIIAPSYNMTMTPNSFVEIGSSISPTLNISFNRGSITQTDGSGNTVSRAGVSNNYSFYNNSDVLLSSQTSSTYNFTPYVVVSGINRFKGTVSYNDGVQPVDSKGNNYLSPLLAGTLSGQTSQFEGVYPIFATTVSITTATKQILISMISANNIQYNLVAETGGNKQFIEIPNTWLSSRPLTAINYFNTISGSFDNTNKISDFNISDVTETIQGNIITYKRYTYNGANRGSILIRLVF